MALVSERWHGIKILLRGWWRETSSLKQGTLWRGTIQGRLSAFVSLVQFRRSLLWRHNCWSNKRNTSQVRYLIRDGTHYTCLDLNFGSMMAVEDQEGLGSRTTVGFREFGPRMAAGD